MVVKFEVPITVSNIFLYTAARSTSVYTKKLEPHGHKDIVWLYTQGDTLLSHVWALEGFVMGLASNMSILLRKSLYVEGEKKCVQILNIYDTKYDLDEKEIAKIIRDAVNVGSGFVEAG